MAVLLAASIAVVAWTRGADGGLTVPPNYVGIIDVRTGTVTAAGCRSGSGPGPIAAGAGAVWVGNLEDRNLTRIDLGAARPSRRCR